MPDVNRGRLRMGRHRRPARGDVVEGGGNRARWLALPSLLPSAAAWCQDNPYVYVKMSMAVPWTLYFLFLAAVLIPFLVMIVLAWQGRTVRYGRAASHGRAEDTPDDDSSRRGRPGFGD